MLSYRLEKAHQKYQQTIENIAAENSKLRNQVGPYIKIISLRV